MNIANILFIFYSIFYGYYCVHHIGKIMLYYNKGGSTENMPEQGGFWGSAYQGRTLVQCILMLLLVYYKQYKISFILSNLMILFHISGALATYYNEAPQPISYYIFDLTFMVLFIFCSIYYYILM